MAALSAARHFGSTGPPRELAEGSSTLDFRGIMNIQDLRTLLDYHYWARDRMLAALAPLTQEQFTRELGSASPRSRTPRHVYSAEWAWHQRWLGQSPTAQLPRETFPDVATVATMWRKTGTDVRGFLESLGEEGAPTASSSTRRSPVMRPLPRSGTCSSTWSITAATTAVKSPPCCASSACPRRKAPTSSASIAHESRREGRPKGSAATAAP